MTFRPMAETVDCEYAVYIGRDSDDHGRRTARVLQVHDGPGRASDLARCLRQDPATSHDTWLSVTPQSPAPMSSRE